MKAFVVIAIFIALQACSNIESYNGIEAGNILELKERLTIRANSARISIQFGKIVNYSQIDNYYPHCWFISWKRKTEPQIIKVDKFEIISVIETFDLVKRESGGFRLSAISVADSGLTAVEYITEIHLRSEKQPHIKRLICSHWEDPSDAAHLSLQQIQNTLGNIAAIR